MTGMWTLIARISTHKACCKQTLAAVCVCVCVCGGGTGGGREGGCVFNP